MNLSRILPRPLSSQPQGSDCASILLSLIMSAHLDRSMSRSLGWRGVKPAGENAFTCRVMGSPCVFGVSFVREEHNQAIHGVFDLYVFPPAQSPLLDKFPLSALGIALSNDYDQLLRSFSGAAAVYAPFIMGNLALDAPLDGAGLAFTLEAFARLRVISIAGVRDPASADWIIPPGSPDCDAPTFRILLPFFCVLTKTAQAIFSETPEIFISSSKTTGMGIDGNGALAEYPGEQLHQVFLTASFGAPANAAQALNGRRLSHLPALPSQKLAPASQLPLMHILTGFLGSGKTTFLKQWLDFLHGRERYTGVIQNEFGPIDLDSALLASDAVIEALDDGCVCCSLADSLRPGIMRMLEKLPAHQFILETTGVANPVNVADALGQLSDLVRPGLVICVVDIKNLLENGIAPGGIALEQIRGANVVILNKVDLLDGDQQTAIDSLSDRIRQLNPTASIIPASNGKIPFAYLDAMLDDARPNRMLLFHGPEPTHNEEGFASRSVTFDGPIKASELETFIKQCGPGLMRLKGVIDIENEGATIVQYVPGKLELVPDCQLEPSGLSLITRDEK